MHPHCRRGTSSTLESTFRNGAARHSPGPTVTASLLPGPPSGPLLRRKATSLHPVLHLSWSITAWKISTVWSKSYVKKAATFSTKSTTPSTESLAGSSIRKETRWNSGSRLKVNDRGKLHQHEFTSRRTLKPPGCKRGNRPDIRSLLLPVPETSLRRTTAAHRESVSTPNATRMKMPKAKDLTAKQRDDLLKTLKARFEAQMHRHAGVEWSAVRARLESNSARLWSLSEMEQSGGEPDVVDIDAATGELIFMDCSAQSPKGRRSVCYDREALDARKEHKPKNSAVEMATAMGATLLTAA